jgi:hypothetical protein
MAQDLAATVVADGRELVDGALEAIKGVGDAGRDDLEGQVVVVTAHFALSHESLLVST